MVRRVIIRPKAYYDSVTLMRLSAESQRLASEVDQVAVVMGTPANHDLLRAVGHVDALLESVGRPAGGEAAAAAVVRTLDAAVGQLSGTNLALISVPGAYAARAAMRALRAGLHVMLFSDNVPLEREVWLKQEAQRRGLPVMGPDCGTAILGGVPLCFANVVRRGPVGLVCASGTGLQEVSTLIDRLGSGVSHAIGTGGATSPLRWAAS